MQLTDNQIALVKKLATRDVALTRTSGGFALWTLGAMHGEGRTPSNAVSDLDIEALLAQGLLEKIGHGFDSLRPTYKLFAKADCLPKVSHWIPSDDAHVYRGPAFK